MLYYNNRDFERRTEMRLRL